MKKISFNKIILVSLFFIFCTFYSCSNALLPTTEKLSTPKSGTKIVTINLSTTDSVFSTKQSSNQNARLIAPSNSEVNRWELTIKDKSGTSTTLTSSDPTPSFSYSLSVGKTYSFTIKGLKESADIKTLFEGSLEKQITEDTTSITLFVSYAINNEATGSFEYTINAVPYAGESSSSYTAQLTKYPNTEDSAHISLTTTHLDSENQTSTTLTINSEPIPAGYYELSVVYNRIDGRGTTVSTTDLSPVDNIVLILDGVITKGSSTWTYNDNLDKEILFASPDGATEGTNIGKTPYVPCSLDYALNYTVSDATVYVYYSGDNPEIDIEKLNTTISRTIKIYNDDEGNSPCLSIVVICDSDNPENKKINITSELDFSIKDSSGEPALVSLYPYDSNTKIALTISENANICLMDSLTNNGTVNCLSKIGSININGIPKNVQIRVDGVSIGNGVYNIPITLSDSVISSLPSSSQPIFTVPESSPVSLTDVLSNMYIATPGYVFSSVDNTPDGKIVAQPYVMWKNDGSILIGDIKDTINAPFIDTDSANKYIDSCIDSMGNIWLTNGTNLVRYTPTAIASNLNYDTQEISIVIDSNYTISSITYDSFTDRIYLTCVSLEGNSIIKLYYINDVSSDSVSFSPTELELELNIALDSIITLAHLTVNADKLFLCYKYTDITNRDIPYTYYILNYYRISDSLELISSVDLDALFINDDALFFDSNSFIPKHLLITDMQVIDNSVYLLITDKYTGKASGISSTLKLISRGGIVKYDFTENSLTLDATFGANDTDSHPAILGWTDGPAIPFKNGSIDYNAYWPANPSQRNDFTYRQNYSFFGPMSFIAIMPKKLVIGDSGYYYYTSYSSTARTTKTTFVEYDLESPAWNGIDLKSLSTRLDSIGSAYQDVTFGFEFDDTNDSGYQRNFSGFPEE